MRKLTEKYWRLICLVLCICPIMLALYFGFQKQGYFVDEVWSYGLANSKNYAHLFMQEGWDADWIPPSYFEHYIEVEPGEQFSYGSVFRNQMEDNHPPFFYLVLHTVSSFFPGKFSKWFGIAPNLFYLLVTNIFLYKILRRLTENKWLAISGMLFYALSAGAVSCTIYIRMYMMLTIWMMILLYIYMKIYERESIRYIDFLICSIVTFAGCMTQYYFYIAVFFSAGTFGLLLLLNKNWKKIIGFIIANLGALLLVYISFPISFTKILGKDNDRGVQAYQSFFDHSYILEKFRTFYQFMNQQLYDGMLSVILFSVVAGCIMIVVYCLIKHKKLELNHEKLFIIVPIVVCIGYLTIMTLVAPYQSDRYIFIIYPISVVCIIYGINKILDAVHIPERYLISVLVVGAILFSYSEIKNNQVQYLYLESLHNRELAEEHNEDDCIYVSDQSYLITADVPELVKYRRVLKTDYEHLSYVRDWLDLNTKEVIVYFDWVLGVDIAQRGNEIAQDLQMKQWEHLYSTDKCCVYRIYN